MLTYESQRSISMGKLQLSKSKSLFPSLNTSNSKTKTNKYINYNVMLSLPLIVKERSILERKKTIDIFKKKKIELFNNQGKKKEKKSLLNNGRIYINEFWSDKYQQTVLYESKIQTQLEHIQALTRKNVNELIMEVHDSIQENGTKLNEIQAYNEMVIAYRQYQKDQVKILKTQSSVPTSQNPVKQDDTETNNQFMTQVYKRSHYRMKTNLQLSQLHVGEDSVEIGKDISLIPQFSQDNSIEFKDKYRNQFKSDFSLLMKQCMKAKFPDRDIEKLEHKPWLSNCAKNINPEKGFKSRRLNNSEGRKEQLAQ